MAGPKNSRRRERFLAEAGNLIEAPLFALLGTRLKLGERICVGFSGGMDSVVLLHALRRTVEKCWGRQSAFPLSMCITASVPVPMSGRIFAPNSGQRYDVPLEVVRVVVPRASAVLKAQHGVCVMAFLRNAGRTGWFWRITATTRPRR